jgi:hypothetical protein
LIFAATATTELQIWGAMSKKTAVYGDLCSDAICLSTTKVLFRSCTEVARASAACLSKGGRFRADEMHSRTTSASPVIRKSNSAVLLCF